MTDIARLEALTEATFTDEWKPVARQLFAELRAARTVVTDARNVHDAHRYGDSSLCDLAVDRLGISLEAYDRATKDKP